MTCIVGLAHEGKVYIGGDSAGVGGYSLTVRADRKVFRNGDFVMGFTDSFRMGQLLHHAFTPPKRHPDVDIDKFMVTEFIDAVRRRWKPPRGFLRAFAARFIWRIPYELHGPRLEGEEPAIRAHPRKARL